MKCSRLCIIQQWSIWCGNEILLRASAVTIVFHISSPIGRNGDKRQAASQSEWAMQSWQVSRKQQLTSLLLHVVRESRGKSEQSRISGSHSTRVTGGNEILKAFKATAKLWNIYWFQHDFDFQQWTNITPCMRWNKYQGHQKHVIKQHGQYWHLGALLNSRRSGKALKLVPAYWVLRYIKAPRR